MMTADTLSQEAMALAPDKRLKLACALIESVEADDSPSPDSAWDTEIRERISRYDRGETSSVPASEVFCKLREIAPAK
jgi:putative addiction module component (TIGR02574 family)